MKSTLLACLALCISHPSFAAADFPERPVRLIVSTSAGAGMDLTTRVVGEKLSTLWGKPVIVENRPGGSGMIAVNALKSSRDGHTILVADIGVAAINPSLYKQPPYEPRTDFKPITDVFQTSFMFLVRPDRYGSLQDLMTAARAKPGSLNYGSAGVGSGQRLSVELFASHTGTSLTYIPYRGNSEAIVALLAGEVDLVSQGLPPVKGYLEEGKLKALATTGPERTDMTRDISTLAELTGVAELAADSWVGFFGPPDMPEAVVQKVQEDVRQVLALPDVKTFFHANDYQFGGNTAATFAARIEADREKYAQLIRTINISLD